MILNCPDCSASYIVPASTFAVGARNVRCAKCGHVWLADLPSSTTAFAWPEAPSAPVFSAVPSFAAPPPPPEHFETSGKIIANDSELAQLARDEKREKTSLNLVKDDLEKESDVGTASTGISPPSALDYTAFETALEALSASLRIKDAFETPIPHKQPPAPSFESDFSFSSSPAPSPASFLASRKHASSKDAQQEKESSKQTKNGDENNLEHLREINPSLAAFLAPSAQPLTETRAPFERQFFRDFRETDLDKQDLEIQEMEKQDPHKLDVRKIDVHKKAPPPRVRLPVVWADPRLTRLRRVLAMVGLVGVFLSGIVWSFVQGPLQDFEMPDLSAPAFEMPTLTLPHFSLPTIDLPKSPIRKKQAPQAAKEILGKDLKFQNVRSERRFEDGTMQLVVDGEIRNPTQNIIQIPALKITALNVEGEILETWRIDPPRPQIEGNGIAPFHTAITAPQGAVVQVNLRFVPITAPPLAEGAVPQDFSRPAAAGPEPVMPVTPAKSGEISDSPDGLTDNSAGRDLLQTLPDTRQDTSNAALP